ncbi:hypothetical protein FK178_13380 [Antarcticibacterium arcticum]|uniref:Phosphoenolpyruvate synthase n=1 Tax=Antarcticibacterium arcticum TaxID=2585771 RepID=A0A5B8YLN7_9FLAO|nr:PEP/pyruvate-binding domain-containing protein [Antarcticibacterium arcticum]QED38644.1 hypothetical protein FK178_13380 [Antarcticibacterium arcticum]
MIIYGNKNQKGVGGKASGLYNLREMGLQVPDFLVIPYENFRVCIAENKDEETVKAALLNYELPPKDQIQLNKILKEWNFPQEPVVVRSSVLDEDGKRNAFPGMMDTFLNISTVADLKQAIAKCAASAWSPRVMEYRRQYDLSLQPKPAVIIQRQINPDASGVLFSTFPEYPQEMAIHAVYGFGEGLMNGSAEGDEFYFERSTGNLHRKNILTKEFYLERGEGSGLIKLPLDVKKQHISCLEPQVLEQLFASASTAEKIAGHPLDIEFAVKDKEIFFLQARPITREIPAIVVYDNSNIQESYCGVTTPLTFSFASRAYKTVYRQTMQVLGIPGRKILAHDAILSNLLGLVKGRIYYNINNWYRGLQLLPSFRQNKADMELMMGLEEPVDLVEDVEKSLSEKIKILPGLLLNYSRLWLKFKKLPELVPAFQENFSRYYTAFYKEEFQTLNSSEFLQKKNDLDENLLNSWSIPIINDFNVMMVNGAVMRGLRKAGITRPEEFITRYLCGDPEIESTQPTLAMINLAETAQQYPGLRELIISFPEDLHTTIERDHPEFYKKVTAFIHQYGDRTVGELKLETFTMRVRPQIFYKYLRNFLAGEKIATADLGKVKAEAEKELETLLQKRSFLFKRKLHKDLKKLKLAIRYRENMRLERTRLFGMYRQVYRARGRALVEDGRLETVEDVFYLTEDELIDLNEAANLKQLIAERKEEFSRYRKQEVPSRVIVPSPPKQEDIAIEETGILKGQGCYPGQVSGEVILIKDPGDSLDVNGKIICALRTDPGWAALFPTCKGVLIEKGSSLSHSVILLRELGIPTIINIPNLCSRLASGDRVKMDAASGEIIRGEAMAAAH